MFGVLLVTLVMRSAVDGWTERTVQTPAPPASTPDLTRYVAMMHGAAEPLAPPPPRAWWEPRSAREIAQGAYVVTLELHEPVNDGQIDCSIPHFATELGNAAVAQGRLPRVMRGSFIASLGLRSGDVIEAVDELGLNDPKNALEAFHRLTTPGRVEMKIRRGRLPLRLSYWIVAEGL